jgi:hypothetical protein
MATTPKGSEGTYFRAILGLDVDGAPCSETNDLRDCRVMAGNVA